MYSQKSEDSEYEALAYMLALSLEDEEMAEQFRRTISSASRSVRKPVQRTVRKKNGSGY